METTQKKAVQTILDKIKSESFVAGYKATDAEAMGLLLSKYFDWNGVDILQTTYWALEDANFHTDNETIQVLIDNLKGKYKKL